MAGREELWKLVKRRVTGVDQRARRRARHPELFLVCVTQQRSDLAGPWGKALLDNSTMQLFLRRSPDELGYLREALKLTDAEPREYWICTSDPISDVPEREAALRQTDEDAWAALEFLIEHS